MKKENDDEDSEELGSDYEYPPVDADMQPLPEAVPSQQPSGELLQKKPSLDLTENGKSSPTLRPSSKGSPRKISLSPSGRLSPKGHPLTPTGRQRLESLDLKSDDMYDTISEAPSDIMYRRDSQFARPTAKQMLGGEKQTLDQQSRVEELTQAQEREAMEEVKRTKFGMWQGVFTNCLLTIWGIMLFLRLGWLTGTAGVLCATLIVLASNVVTSITASSLSAICTNGHVAGGGAYFMISRSLGPEFGGSMGLLYSLAQAGAVALYLVGFAETVVGRFPQGYHMMGDGSWDTRLIGLLAFIFVCGVVAVGMKWVVKAQLLLLGVVLVALSSFFVGTFLSEDKSVYGHVGYSSAVLESNLWPTWGEETFFSLFGVFFPACTGIMAGANISGDLSNPNVAIPKGTFLAIAVTGTGYVVVVWLLGSSVLKDAGLQLANGRFPHGLLNDFDVMVEVSVWGPLVLAGVFAASLSSAIGSFVGAPRIFQQLARDNVFPQLKRFHFDKGHGVNDEPLYCYGLCVVVVLSFLLVGKLNAIAPFITNFFLVSYAFINYACFASTHTHSPSWRPSFTYFNKWVSLFGVLLCLFMMFTISPVTAFVTILTCAALWKFIDLHPPDVNWGSAVQARAFKDALVSTTRLEHSKEHVKTFRPSTLVLSTYSHDAQVTLRQLEVVALASQLSQAGFGACIYGRVVQGSYEDPDTADSLDVLRGSKVLVARGIQGFVSALVSKDVREGYRSLMQCCGIGKMRPNQIMLPFEQHWARQAAAAVQEYVAVMRDAIRLGMAVVVCRNPPALPPHKQQQQEKEEKEGVVELAEVVAEDDKVVARARRASRFRSIFSPPALPQHAGRIDVYWLADDGGLTVLLPWLLKATDCWRRCSMRVLAPDSSDSLTTSAKLVELLRRFRIEAKVELLEGLGDACKPETKQRWEKEKEFAELIASSSKRFNKAMRFGEVLHQHSADASLVVMSLPVPRFQLSWKEYMSCVHVSSQLDGVPTLLVRGLEQVLTMYS